MRDLISADIDIFAEGHRRRTIADARAASDAATKRQILEIQSRIAARKAEREALAKPSKPYQFKKFWEP